MDHGEADALATIKRVFVNRIDSFSSKFIAKFLSTCVPGGSLEETDEEESTAAPRAETYQIVGTVADKVVAKQTFALEQFSSQNRDQLLKHLLECDVIVYNITEHADEIDEATWAISALHAEMDNFRPCKMFILVSTLMTWALTKPTDPHDPDVLLTDSDFRRKRPHPNFKEHSSAEKLVLKLGKTKKSKLSSYVVASGLQYGMGENFLHYFFKASWLAEVTEIPVFGPSTNTLPTIHVSDLARVVQNIVDHKPKSQCLIAVDESKNTLKEIVIAISKELGPGRVKQVPTEMALLTKALTQTELDLLNMDLQVEAVSLKENLNVNWSYESGIVESIVQIVEEFRESRQLLPIKICILGPPAIGKTTVAKGLCKSYKLHYIQVEDVIKEKIEHLEEAVQSGNVENESEEMLKNATDLMELLKSGLSRREGQLNENHVFSTVRERLMSKPCLNQGYVLDGYPNTYEQAKELFYDEEPQTEEARPKITPYNKRIIPEHILSLEASDEFLQERVRNLPENVVQEMGYTQDEFVDRLATFRALRGRDETVLDYFDELEIHPEHIEMNGTSDAIGKIITIVGKPKNYGPTAEEREEEERRTASLRRQQLQQQADEMNLREAEEAARRAAEEQARNRHRAEVKRQERELLEARSLPLRNYLMKYVMPTLSQGMSECCKVRPEDPVDFLAEYLIRSSSEEP